MFSLIFSLHIGVMDLYCKKLIQYQSTRFSLKFQEIQKTFSKNSHFKKKKYKKYVFIGVHTIKSLKNIKNYIIFPYKI